MLAFDIGGTKVHVALLSGDGRVLSQDRYAVGADRCPEVLVDKLVARCHGLLGAAGLSPGDVGGIACSMAAMMDLSRGVVRSAPILGWQDYPLRAELEMRLGQAVHLEMDAYAMTLGEARWGAVAGRRHVVGVTVGTGIGAGLVLDGHAYHGRGGLAGEVGHTIVVPGGPLCNCGSRGCLEMLASGPAIAEQARGAITQGRRTLLHELRDDQGQLTAREVFAAARQSDEAALDIVESAATFLGIAVANLITLLDVDAVVLGGGVMTGGADLLLPLVRRAADAHRGYWTRAKPVEIVVGQLGDAAPLMGAAAPFLSDPVPLGT